MMAQIAAVVKVWMRERSIEGVQELRNCNLA